jgi:hypothetical protein
MNLLSMQLSICIGLNLDIFRKVSRADQSLMVISQFMDNYY